MKRMIDYKEFLELQDLASRNDLRLDYIEGAYTYFNLGLDDANFDHLLPGSPEDLQPQTLRIGDTVYIEGAAATLDADMIKEIFDSNLVILDCGDSTEYPTVILQRQYVDEESAALSPRNARFKAFVTYGVALFEYTMTVAEYDETSEAGGYIAISCKENATKPIYFHGLDLYLSGHNTFNPHILNNSPEPIDTLDKLHAWFLSFGNMRVQVPGTGNVIINGVSYSLVKITRSETDSYSLYYVGETRYESVYIGTWSNITQYLDSITDSVNRVN